MGIDLSLPSKSVQRESATNVLLMPTRRALWKILDQFTTPRQRALQKLYQELADIKCGQAMLEGNRTMTSVVSESQGVAINPPNTGAPQASWNSLAFTTEFRGGFLDIKESQRDHLDYFIGEGPFPDIGCGPASSWSCLRSQDNQALASNWTQFQ